MNTTERPLPLIVKMAHYPIPSALGRLLHDKVKVAVTDNSIWLRIDSKDVRAQSLARGLPGIHYWLESEQWLIAVGQQVASLRLPELGWQEFRDVAELQLPLAAIPGRLKLTELPELEMRSGGHERPCQVGLFEHELLDHWISAAPATRLSKLVACLSDNWVLVIGDPLPPLPCKYFWKEDRVLMPAGKIWYPSISATQLLEHFEVAEDHLLLWFAEQEWTTIPCESMKPLQRGSWRRRN